MAKSCKAKELNGKVYRCFFELTLRVMGGKWKPIIIYHLDQEKVLRFSELRRAMSGVTERMLTRQLRELEADAIVIRRVYKQVPPKVEYTLTPMGTKLMPILSELRDWGADYERLFGKDAMFSGEGYETAALAT